MIFAMTANVTRALHAVVYIGRTGVITRQITKIKPVTHCILKANQTMFPAVGGAVNIMTGNTRHTLTTHMLVMQSFKSTWPI
ncbi:MAG: hypothetical protein D6816_02910 [Bacteroidetes bacterium]|nr:MAG: hypothetical protein D6816_02910 [Bacteroidota bacterium]